MADDDMEISSEHGHNTIEEDIDIDIDLSAGHVDEDYILEDAQSNTGFGDDFQPQPPAAAPDDLMIDDEDNASYSMEDDPPQEQDNQEMDQEAIAMSFTENTNDHLDDNGPLRANHADGGGSNQEADTMWDTTEDQNESTGIPAALPEDLGESVDATADKVSNDTTEEVQENPTTLHQDDHNPSPHKQSPQKDSPRSPNLRSRSPSPNSTLNVPESLSDAQLETEKSVHLQPDPGNDKHSDADDIEKPVNEDVNILASVRRTIVSYHSTEYALFSTSEEDDPDSFFLSDLTIAEKSIADLLAAVQEVIIEDLADEESVCMAILDLGLELDQTNTQSHQMTLRQIVGLRDKLLLNDGVEAPEPLYIHLGTVPDFPARLMRLTSGAADGKGLSQLNTWDARRETYVDDAGDLEDSKYNEESQLETQLETSESRGEAVNEVLEVLDEVESTNVNVTKLEGEDVVSQPHEASQSSPGEKDKLLSASGFTGSPIGDGPSDDKTLTFKVESIGAQPSAGHSNSAHEEEEEDGDLIDYEDEEFDHRYDTALNHIANSAAEGGSSQNGTLADLISPCYKPGTCFCSTCNALLVEEYAAINEELRRRSISRAEDSSLAEHSIEETIGADYSKGNHETVTEAENGTTYNETHENQAVQTAVDEIEDEGVDPNGNSETHEFGDDHPDDHNGLAAEDDIYGEDAAPEDGHFSKYEVDPIAKINELDAEDGHNNDHTFETFGDELEVGDEEVEASRLTESRQEAGTDERTSTEGDIDKVDGNAITKEAPSAASSLGTADAADSESATIASANTLEADEISYETDDNTHDNPKNDGITYPVEEDLSVPGGPGDEIDYEDEDEADAEAVQPAPTPTNKSPIHNGGSAKRPRADADLEDAADAQTKEAKRVRS